MEKKIGTFLMVMLVLCAVLILMATAARDTQADPPETTATTAPSETKGQTQPPASTEPAPTQTEQTGQLTQAELRVKQLLDACTLDETAATRRSAASGLSKLEGTAGAWEQSAAYALAFQAQNRKLNPIAAFWLLVEDGAYEWETEDSPLPVSGFSPPTQSTERYAYSSDGVRKLLSELLVTAAEMSDALDLELAILGSNLSVEADQVFHSAEDDCRYAYFSASSDRSTHILCFYLRSDAKGEWIADVEFQLLSVRHATGDAAALGQIRDSFDRQAAVLMAAAELLMTGGTKAAEGQVPEQYAVGSRSASVERFRFTAENEQGTLVNYRLR